LQWNINRWYDANVGRWISEDPIGFEAGDGNLYRYVGNNIICLWDELGLADYKEGDEDLIIKHDKGSGIHGAEKGKYKDSDLDKISKLLKRCIWGAKQLSMDVAASHMEHYLANTGTTMTVNYERLLKDVPSQIRILNTEINEAREYVENSLTNDAEFFNITSKTASGGYCKDEDNWNWYFAVGGYSIWGKGTAIKNGNCYDMLLQITFEDFYNWDEGKKVAILGTTIADKDVGKLHKAGIAYEFLMTGQVTYIQKWKKGERIK
jgi:uncharacterized protein RhaS with RHS repeats